MTDNIVPAPWLLDIDRGEQALAKARARRHLIDFIELDGYPYWKRAKHLELLCSKLEDIERYIRGDTNGLARLIVTMPPRHGKSHVISKKFPAWLLARNPDIEVILATYGAELAQDHSEIARDTFREWAPKLWNLSLSEKTQAKAKWKIADHRGGMAAVGIGGAATGRGASCVPGETLITTEHGQIPIKTYIYMENKPKVLSFNHNTNQLEWKDVIAHRITNSNRLFEIETICGNKLCATPNHRIFVQHGYTKMDSIFPGDGVITQQTRTRNLCLLRKENLPKKQIMPSVLSKSQACNSNNGMQFLWETLSSRIRKYTKCSKRTQRAFLLFRKVFLQPLFKITYQNLSDMWSRNGKISFEILFGKMQKGSKKNIYRFKTYNKNYKNMRNLWRVLQNYTILQKPKYLLFKQMRRFSPFSTNGRNRKQSLLPRQLYKLNNRRTSYNSSRKRQSNLRSLSKRRRVQKSNGLWEFGRSIKSCCSSYKWEQQRKLPRKFDNTMPEMSSDSSRFKRDTICLVRELCQKSIPVYDIQVKDNQNFFANNILVHNCLIVDDPVENAESAMSSTMQEKIWNWWQTVSYTRLSPTGAVVILMTRWAQQDLVGKILDFDKESERPQNWEVLNLPAICEEENDPIGRAIGDVLWPERFSTNWILDKKANTESFWWQSMWQQKPADITNQVFRPEDMKLIDPTTVNLSYCDFYGACDASEGGNDYAVIAIVAVLPDNRWLVWNADLSIDNQSTTIEKIVKFSKQYKFKRFWIEQNSLGHAKSAVGKSNFEHRLIEQLQKNKVILPYIFVWNSENKVNRIRSLEPYYIQGKLLFRDDHHKVYKLLTEQLRFFPFYQHDDGPDALELCIRGIVRESSSVMLPKVPKQLIRVGGGWTG